MITADDLDLASPPAPLPEPLEQLTKRWPAWQTAEFDKMGPACVCIVGMHDLFTGSVYHPDGTVTRFGHNRLSRAVKVGVSESWKDTMTPRVDQVAYWRQGLLVRIWVRSQAHAKLLMLAVIEHLSEIGEGTLDLRREFIDVGADVDLARLTTDLRAVADRMDMDSWDDDDLVHHLTQSHVRKMEAERLALAKAVRGGN